ncbi:MAG: type IV pilus twitching motility protein PilT [candidate division Zixibacteria bacterium]|nr:type IV pilus twitching motility protein PilT [candidate division Zixibacteria bacterium]
MKELGASDVHLTTGAPVTFRIHGDLVPANDRPMQSAEVGLLLYEILASEQIKRYEESWDLDSAHTIPGYARFRVNLFRSHRGPGGVLRLIPEDPPTLAELGMPEIVTHLAETPRGLILVTGPTNSGKSTTLAAMINHLNETQTRHIVTLEDPVEFVHANKHSLITQRQVGAHTHDFASALRAALREDANVILVGEMRDLETIHLALTAAELGLCVFGTLHTKSAAQTVNRLIDAFPPDQQSQIRVLLSEGLKGVIAQQLVRRADDRGRLAALEIMINTPAIANMIREGKTHQIGTNIQTGRRDGMQLIEQHLTQLADDGLITWETAMVAAGNPSLLTTAARQKPELAAA